MDVAGGRPTHRPSLWRSAQADRSFRERRCGGFSTAAERRRLYPQLCRGPVSVGEKRGVAPTLGSGNAVGLYQMVQAGPSPGPTAGTVTLAYAQKAILSAYS